MVVIAAIVACGGGGGGGVNSPTAPTPNPPQGGLTATYSPASQAGAQSLSLQSQPGTDGRMTLDLTATDVDGLYGMAFDLRFPSSILRFEQASEGDDLSANGTIETSFLVSQSESGVVIVGLSRLGAAEGLSGSAVLMSFEFTPLSAGQGDLAFESASAVDARGVNLSGIRWVNGTADVG